MRQAASCGAMACRTGYLVRRCATALLVAAFAVSMPEITPAWADSYRDLSTILRSLAPRERPPGERDRRRAIDLTVPFGVDSAKIGPRAKVQLDVLGRALLRKELEGMRFRIAGHTDASGPAAYNRNLSRRRAQAVRDYLVGRHGIDPARLDPVGYGEERLKDPFAPKSPVNRRVEIIALGKALPAGASSGAKKGFRW